MMKKEKLTLYRIEDNEEGRTIHYDTHWICTGCFIEISGVLQKRTDEIFEELEKIFNSKPSFDTVGRNREIVEPTLTDKGVLQNTAIIRSEIKQLKQKFKEMDKK